MGGSFGNCQVLYELLHCNCYCWRHDRLMTLRTRREEKAWFLPDSHEINLHDHACISGWLLFIPKNLHLYYLPWIAKMKKDSCNLEVKQMLSNMAASSHMFRPILCQPQILVKQLNREAQGLPSCFFPELFCCTLENPAWGPGYFICVLGGRGGAEAARKINTFLRQGWLVSALLKGTLVTTSVEGLNFPASLTFHRAQASLERLTHPPTPLASCFSSSQSAFWV